ncbi:ParB N-terminal domain-containing protein [Botrimarina sp.]|uniref:ParB N-terminal domain-containing protein n=1 Tax=Botrimarina sp. TaxID=2795802 RepID=UPI0032ECF68C
MKVRDRVKQLRRVRASELVPHPKNWRSHPRFQQDVLRDLLREVGVADALLARELPDGRLQLVDGHLRAALSPSATVPVLVLDLDEAEAEKVLLTHDPLAALAVADEARLTELLAGVETRSAPIRELLGKLARESAPEALLPPPEVAIGASYQVVADVDDEPQQQALYERLKADGYRCRVLTL